MLTTELEALQKMCHNTNIGVVGIPSNQSACIGSYCMAWRWDKPGRDTLPRFQVAKNKGAVTEHEAGKKPAHCKGWEFIPCEEDAAGWVEPQEEAAARRRGFCGLAGDPRGHDEYDQILARYTELIEAYQRDANK